jgi:RNA polymerase sigma-70 factor (ECF subfamily)
MRPREIADEPAEVPEEPPYEADDDDFEDDLLPVGGGDEEMADDAELGSRADWLKSGESPDRRPNALDEQSEEAFEDDDYLPANEVEPYDDLEEGVDQDDDTAGTAPETGRAAPQPAVPPGTVTGAVFGGMVITELPRMRRFCTAWLADPAAADRLVALCLQAAMSERAAAHRIDGLGIRLLATLHELHAETAEDDAAPPDQASGFDRSLVEDLPGADADELAEFAHAIARLSLAEREVLLLAALEGLTYPDIAQVVAAPVSEVVARLVEARENLRRALLREDRTE